MCILPFKFPTQADIANVKYLYWCNENTTNRHLCPTFEPGKHFKTDIPPLRKTTIEARLELIEKHLIEIKEILKNGS
jgi:hypothetical protein